MEFHLFGASTPAGEALKQQLRYTNPTIPLVSYSRRDPLFLPADFRDPCAFHPGGVPGSPCVWISFGPIWLLAPFLQELSHKHPERLQGVLGVIACSSSSAITKRFASNRFDRELVAKLLTAESSLISICQRMKLTCKVLRPTLIYGRVGTYLDRNLSRLILLMRRLPFLPLPAQTGLRQPIHASQLAAVVLALAHRLIESGCDPQHPECIALGGDSELSYADMLRALKHSLPLQDPARRCRLLPIPTRIFQAASTPLLLHSPKGFEAMMRVSADLSGFIPAHQLLNTQPQKFPVFPLL